MSDFSEDQVIRAMVRILCAHPAEWLSFRQLSRLARVDESLLQGYADYRPDLFAIAQGRKLKLRTETFEKAVRVGIEKWEIPPRIEKEIDFPVYRNVPIGGADRRGCYRTAPTHEILTELVNESVPDEALLNNCCWKTVCRVRGLNFSAVDPQAWIRLCARRGYLSERQNPRGF